MSSQLAISGGTPVIAAGSIQASPPTCAIDEEMVLASLRGGSHAWGENCEKLQSEWAQWNGNKYCAALTSGTSALHMALVACGMQAGDEILTPAYSWTSSASCILHGNGIPVFVDTDPVWANIDPARIEAAITPRTRGIIAVHLHGVPAPMDEIMEIAKRHNLFVVEDACQAHGALYRGRKVGTIGHAAAFSLNQNKMLSSGEGGLFVTSDEQTYNRGRSLVLFGDFPRGEMAPDRANGMGWMYRYNDLCSAYARAQLTQLDGSIAHARHLFALLREGLADLPGLIVATEPEWGTENGYNFVCHLDPAAYGYDGPVNFLREAIVNALAAEGAPAFVWQRYILPEFAPFVARNAYGNGSPWREHGSEVSYDPSQFPQALYHSASYFVFGNLRQPNTESLAQGIVEAVHKVWNSRDELDIDVLARNADVSIYERGWRKHDGGEIKAVPVVSAAAV